MSKQYGKGSNRRKEDARKVRENWDSIKGFRKMRAQLKERSDNERADDSDEN